MTRTTASGKLHWSRIPGSTGSLLLSVEYIDNDIIDPDPDIYADLSARLSKSPTSTISCS